MLPKDMKSLKHVALMTENESKKLYWTMKMNNGIGSK